MLYEDDESHIWFFYIYMIPFSSISVFPNTPLKLLRNQSTEQLVPQAGITERT